MQICEAVVLPGKLVSKMYDETGVSKYDFFEQSGGSRIGKMGVIELSQNAQTAWVSHRIGSNREGGRMRQRSRG